MGKCRINLGMRRVPRAGNLYSIGSRHPLGHPRTAVLLRETTTTMIIMMMMIIIIIICWASLHTWTVVPANSRGKRIEEVLQMKVTVKFTPHPLYLRENTPRYPLRMMVGLTRRQERF
jgi:hypothetical protein